VLDQLQLISSPFAVVLASFGNATEALKLRDFALHFTIFEATIVSFVKFSKDASGANVLVIIGLLGVTYSFGLVFRRRSLVLATKIEAT